ncbi:Ail/Lom family outer membrane beta-barrel protein [Arsenophonus nasoniae]|uniref:Ail/Lom family outer membrane beta-barrel protein n=1 Tax=Arsenophonus nasoniae TaxID=638 RepID=A0AA95KCJ8_9GAMM|nr:Ail/Lom family outer membrane beta-barrel protein [Arsenophonus nasoniae]WGM00354.1 Ail/Lom family outer membrane beta-barrel protein [Arsenophonus nasoniae]WGM01901.1 Ail/Lom family outer membrane beta-barrel protein [Arsenophonus nasoniae]
MKKVLIAATVASVFAFMSANSYAVGESTLSLGYAQSHAKVSGEKIDDNPKGFNIKYRYEIDNHWGVIGSFAYTHQGYNFYYGKMKIADADIDYYSLNAGPVYRFNEYISAYGLIGLAHGKVEARAVGYSADDSATGLAYGVGLQFNPVKNIAIDASYEYSKLDEVKAGTWMIGVGYRF